ncbi:C2 domain containing protein [Trema orientale]|uniref:C2 domain containing protein n=1 Tax=Trema orientale TaxID=63057 RepID=A0A2P5E813_TREOI|nr:C2 domain containing protein [Trema orientale]
MDYRSLDIDITSLEGLKPRNGLLLFSKTRFYAVVSLVTTTSISTQKTQLGHFQGRNKYTWSSPNPMRFYVKESKVQQNSAILMIQIRSKRQLFADKDIGEVYVPLKDLFDQSLNDTENIAVYQVEMRRKTAASFKPAKALHLNFSFKFSGSFKLFRRAIRNSFCDDDVSRMRLTKLRSAARRALYLSAPNNSDFSRIASNPVYQILWFS